MTIFMSYTMARPIWTAPEKVAFISECLSQETVSYVERTIYRYQENIDCDKTRQGAWTNRLNYAIRGRVVKRFEKLFSSQFGMFVKL